MVSKSLQTLSKVEKELEHMVDNGEKPDETEKLLKEARHLAEQTAFSAIRSTETWGKAALERTKNKVNEIKEEIIL